MIATTSIVKGKYPRRRVMLWLAFLAAFVAVALTVTFQYVRHNAEPSSSEALKK